jgi:PHD/YefM family antitoxin component YafN of YafNO toxin-antitoxin module
VEQLATRHEPEVVYRNGEPVAVILEIQEYQEMLERLEDIEDLELVREMRGRPLQFRALDDFLEEYTPSV